MGVKPDQYVQCPAALKQMVCIPFHLKYGHCVSASRAPSNSERMISVRVKITTLNTYISSTWLPSTCSMLTTWVRAAGWQGVKQCRDMREIIMWIMTYQSGISRASDPDFITEKVQSVYIKYMINYFSCFIISPLFTTAN